MITNTSIPVITDVFAKLGRFVFVGIETEFLSSTYSTLFLMISLLSIYTFLHPGEYSLLQTSAFNHAAVMP